MRASPSAGRMRRFLLPRPFFAPETLTPEDRIMDLNIKIAEYLDFGVRYVWVIDSCSHTGEIYTRDGIQNVGDGNFKAGPIEIDLGELEP
jgi:Uma2 family endonuclease